MHDLSGDHNTDLRRIVLIQELVAARLSVGIPTLIGDNRSYQASYARGLAVYLSRTNTTASFPTIGRAFGGRNHSTIMRYFHKVEAMRVKDLKLHSLINDLTVSIQLDKTGESLQGSIHGILFELETTLIRAARRRPNEVLRLLLSVADRMKALKEGKG